MALIVADRVQETTTTTGTGTYTLAGAKDGFQSFAAVGDGNTTYYACTDGTDYEIGIGTYTATGTTLARTTIIESSNSDLAVSWGAGSKDIFVTAPASKTLLVGRNLYADNPSSATMPSATGSNAIALGNDAVAAGSGSVALGTSYASGTDSFAAQIGTNSSSYGAVGNNSTAVGMLTKANGLDFVFGRSSIASGGSGSLSLGMDNTSSGGGAVTLGKNNTASHIDAVVIGQGASSSAADEITLGHTDQTVRISSSYTLPTSDGTNGQVLTTNGAGAVTFADAGGGSTITVDSKTAAYTIVSGDVGKLISFSGGSYTASLTAAATLGNGFYVYIENNAANGQNTHVITIDPNASETIDGRSTMPLRQGQRILIVCDGSNWKTVADFNRAIATNATTTFFNLPQATGDESVAIGLGSVASNTNTTAIGLNAEATGSYATSFGTSTEATAFGSVASGYNAVSAGSQSIALGVSRASGADSFAAAITNNTSSYGATNTGSIAFGTQNKAAGYESFVAGGYANTANNYRSSVLNGTNNTVNSNYGTILGGENNTINSNSNYSIILCGEQNEAGQQYTVASGLRAKTYVIGQWAHSAGHFSATGDAQSSKYVLRSDTTDATAEVLTSTNTSGAINNQVKVSTDVAVAFHGTIVAKQSGSANAAAWKVEGLIVNNGGTTTLTNSATTVISNTPSWGMALSADDTNDALAITVTGAAATNIRWVATIHTSEVTYA